MDAWIIRLRWVALFLGLLLVVPLVVAFIVIQTVPPHLTVDALNLLDYCNFDNYPTAKVFGTMERGTGGGRDPARFGGRV